MPDAVTTVKSTNIRWHSTLVTPEERSRVLKQSGCVIWLTGLSGSGKSTIARALEKRLIRQARPAYVLDGDNVRHGLNRDLAFSPSDRSENIRRVGEVAGLFADAGVICITAFISPYRADRLQASETIGHHRFVEVHVNAPLAECERRDPKGLYAKARRGEISQFTGIDAPYEPPEAPAVVVHTDRETINESVRKILTHLRIHGVLHSGAVPLTQGDGI
ncbi:MAG: adenylyl-sulfate kinase [Planctomycetota bacterium]